MGEASSLEAAQDFNQLDVRLEQRPLANWAVVAHLSVFVITPVSMLVGAWFLAVPWMLGAMAFFVAGLTWKRPVTLRVTRTELRVDAWAGWPGRRVQRVLPLADLEVEHDGGAHINNRKTYRLTLRPAGEAPLTLRSLACSADDLLRLDALLGQASAEAVAVLGDGAEEVPEALRRLVGKAQPEAQ